ncbi:DNA repair protein RecN [Oscillospiraceae bacterium WX1]
MIQLLHIENIAVIEKADIAFGPGLNVLTGETGAGKSIVIDALTAVLGGRVSRELVRTGAAAAAVTAVFADIGAADWYAENGVEPDEDGQLILMRRVTADGKSTCRINGSPVTAAQLRDLGERLVDIHGQNDGRKLLDERFHIQYLDSFGVLEADRAAYETAYKALRAKEAEIDRLSMDESEKERRLDSLRFQLGELDKADIRPGELDALLARRDLLKNASRLTEATEGAFAALDGSDRTDGAVALIGGAESLIAGAARYAESLGDIAAKLKDLQYAAEDALESLRDVRASLAFSPDEFDTLEARLDTLKRLMRKYGDSEETLIAYREKCRAELDEIEFSADTVLKLERERERLLNDARQKAAALSQARRAAAVKLESRIKAELGALNMAGVRFETAFDDVQGINGLCPTGCDEIRFLMSANAGEAPGRISHIASGGELSRIMLALKNVLSENDETATMVFDEVDAGVSGIAAQRVGEKLASLSRGRQVLCVTHLSQLAVMADTHFEINKTTADGRTFTSVTTLDDVARRHEIARLLGGENITETTLLSAAEQIEAAQAYKNK